VPLEWCNAETSTHREHLSTFRCADPEHSSFDEEKQEEYHDFPWEVEVQEYINALRVPAYPPIFLILGYDGERLAAVLQLRVDHLDSYCWVKAVAVANWAKGEGYAVVAVTDIVHRVMRTYDISMYTIEAHVDRDNDPSQRAFATAGFEHVEIRDGYQLWAKAVS
jgi:RimJ/RimL family protein N-acetyltransferase